MEKCNSFCSESNGDYRRVDSKEETFLGDELFTFEKLSSLQRAAIFNRDTIANIEIDRVRSSKYV